MKTQLLLILIITITSNFIIFSYGNEEVENDKIKVFTSIVPQQYFIKEIGGDRVTCEVLVGPGKSPATYQPVPSQIMKLGSAQILFTIGMPFEKNYLNKTINTMDSLIIVDSTLGIDKRQIDSEHNHGEGNEEDGHSDGAFDPHVWLSPLNSKIISKNIFEALVQFDPEGEIYYRDRYNKLIERFDSIHEELSSLLKPLAGKTIFVYHPSFGYFTGEYGMYQEAVETGGKEPTPKQLEQIIEEAKADGVKMIIVQPEFSKKSAKIIANAIGGSVTTLNPLDVNYFENLRNIANEISVAYK